MFRSVNQLSQQSKAEAYQRTEAILTLWAGRSPAFCCPRANGRAESARLTAWTANLSNPARIGTTGKPECRGPLPSRKSPMRSLGPYSLGYASEHLVPALSRRLRKRHCTFVSSSAWRLQAAIRPLLLYGKPASLRRNHPASYLPCIRPDGERRSGLRPGAVFRPSRRWIPQ